MYRRTFLLGCLLLGGCLSRPLTHEYNHAVKRVVPRRATKEEMEKIEKAMKEIEEAVKDVSFAASKK